MTRKKNENGRAFLIDDTCKSYATEKNLQNAIDKDERIQNMLEDGCCYFQCRTISGRYTIIWVGDAAITRGAHFTGFNCIYG